LVLIFLDHLLEHPVMLHSLPLQGSLNSNRILKTDTLMVVVSSTILAMETCFDSNLGCDRNRNIEHKGVTPMMTQATPRICLTMMVKNEAQIILRCLESVVELVDTWVVCDTGSTDGTQEIIQNFFKERQIPGELHQQEWKNYGHNRTLTLQAAKGKGQYLLLADADYIFHLNSREFLDNLTAPAYNYGNVGSQLSYAMTKLLKGDLDWRYVGVTHEYVDCISDPNFLGKLGTISDFYVEEKYDGGNRTHKFENDIALLSQGLIDEPNNSRYMFYLGRSYEDTKQYELAVRYYRMRAAAGGWREEVYYSNYAIARCMIALNQGYGDVLEASLKAFETIPYRLEAMHELVRYCRVNGHFSCGYLLGHTLVDLPYPSQDILFLNPQVYSWGMKDEVAICAFYTNRFAESQRLNEEILASGAVPADQLERIEKNLNFSKERLKAA
jgi:glycosyltransferase involved in cell wall biosynthesis